MRVRGDSHQFPHLFIMAFHISALKTKASSFNSNTLNRTVFSENLKLTKTYKHC